MCLKYIKLNFENQSTQRKAVSIFRHMHDYPYIISAHRISNQQTLQTVETMKIRDQCVNSNMFLLYSVHMSCPIVHSCDLLVGLDEREANQARSKMENYEAACGHVSQPRQLLYFRTTHDILSFVVYIVSIATLTLLRLPKLSCM